MLKINWTKFQIEVTTIGSISLTVLAIIATNYIEFDYPNLVVLIMAFILPVESLIYALERKKKVPKWYEVSIEDVHRITEELRNMPDGKKIQKTANEHYGNDMKLKEAFYLKVIDQLLDNIIDPCTLTEDGILFNEENY